MHNFVLLFAFLAAYAANLAFLASFSYENTIQNTDIQEIESIHSMFLSSYRNMSGSLGEWEMLWAHEPQASVSTAFLSSLKLSWVFLWLNRNTENMFCLSFRKQHDEKKGNNFFTLIINKENLFSRHHYVNSLCWFCISIEL